MEGLNKEATTFNRSNYTTPVKYILSGNIREYDISKANISILLYYGLITKQQYDYYYHMPKEQREVQVGLLQQKDKELSKALNKGFIKMNNLFLSANNIKESEIVSIKKDSLFLLEKVPSVTTFENNGSTIEYKPKGVYNSYFNILRKEYYYYFNGITGDERIDVKGINDRNLLLHYGYFLDFICDFFNHLQTKRIEETITLVNNFYSKYINYELSVEFYRDFSEYSMYRIKDCPYAISSASQDQLKYMDISYNANLLRELHQIISTMYFRR